MKELYNELLEREKYLKSIEQTEKVQTMLSELMLVIVRVQQLILPVVSNTKRTFDCATCKYGKQPNEKAPCNTCNEFYSNHVAIK